MSIVIEEIKFFDEFKGEGGGGVPNLNGGILGKHTAWIDFYSYRALKGKTIKFTASTKAIELNDELDFDSFIMAGFKEGMDLTIDGSGSNDNTFTIASVEARKITTVEALVDEEAEDVDMFDDTPVVALDLYYNLIENKASESYLSLTDTGAIQRYTVDGIDANSSTPIPMMVASSSFGWVTNELSDEITGETSEVTIEGRDIAAHRQRFRIKHTFFIAPFAVVGQIQNFQELTLPYNFQDGRALRYITKIDGKADFTDTTPIHTGGNIDTATGITTWFDQNNIRSRAEYYFESITFEDSDDNVLDSIDIEKIVDVAITIKSRSGKFVPYGDEESTRFILDFIYFPLNESRYIRTPLTTLHENFLHDRRFCQIGVAANGENYGGDYQVLKQIAGLYVNAETMRVEFKVDFSEYIKTFLKTLPLENRNFFFSVTTQDLSISTTRQSDRVPVLCPLNQIAWDKSNPSLLEAVDNARCYAFPHVGIQARTSFALYEGCSGYLEFPFRIESTPVNEITPTLRKCGAQICIVKEGENDFVLEEKIFDTSAVRKLEGVQTIDVSESRNFGEAFPDQYKIISLKRDETYDSGSKIGSALIYPFVAKYEFWSGIIQRAEEASFPVFENIESPTEAWHTLRDNGWSLKIRFVAEVEGYEGFSEIFDQYWDIDVRMAGTAPDSAPIFEASVRYDDYESGIVTNGIVAGKKTKVTVTYNGNFESLPQDFNTFCAQVFADIENIGGVLKRKFASTEFNSEDDSPFTAPPSDGRADQTWASKNLRINLFNFTKITVETIYDDTKEFWTRKTSDILFYHNISLMSGCFLIDANDKFVLNAVGNRIAINCDEDSDSSS